MSATENKDAGEADEQTDAHDLLASGFGLAALGLLISSPWLVDRSGPEPFYKGPLLFPLIALAIMMAGAVPAIIRLAAKVYGGGFVILRDGWPWAGTKLLLLMCLFPGGLLVVGLDAATVIFTFVGLWVAGYRNPAVAGGVAVVLAIVLHVAFKTVLDIWFPTPLVLDLLPALAT